MDGEKLDTTFYVVWLTKISLHSWVLSVGFCQHLPPLFYFSFRTTVLRHANRDKTIVLSTPSQPSVPVLVRYREKVCRLPPCLNKAILFFAFDRLWPRRIFTSPLWLQQSLLGTILNYHEQLWCPVLITYSNHCLGHWPAPEVPYSFCLNAQFCWCSMLLFFNCSLANTLPYAMPWTNIPVPALTNDTLGDNLFVHALRLIRDIYSSCSALWH